MNVIVLQKDKQSIYDINNIFRKEDIVSHSLDIFKRKFEYFRNNIAEMDSLFEASFTTVAESGQPISRCGKCHRYMKIIRTKPQRLFCPTCNETYTLPQKGTIKLYKEIKCPLDDFELVLFSLGNSVGYQGMSTPLCPQCYNNPPFEDYKGTMTCIQCRNTSCVHSMVNNAICEYIYYYYIC